MWTGDHKGWFRTRDGWRCEPLTVMDASSRYLLALEATGSTADDEAWPVFERLFEEHGLPDRLRSDNGPPFASAGVTGLPTRTASGSPCRTRPRAWLSHVKIRRFVRTAYCQPSRSCAARPTRSAPATLKMNGSRPSPRA
nr:MULTISPECIES: DDE-type integrase/transposase/recombinase [unclassified Mesorhizobium]